MFKTISNHKLELVDFPDENADWSGISRFALTINGYEYHGLFEKCARIANDHSNSMLTDLRTCLFFEQRRWRHFSEFPDAHSMQYIRDLVQQIRDKIINGDCR